MPEYQDGNVIPFLQRRLDRSDRKVRPALASELMELRQEIIQLSARAIVLLNEVAHHLDAPS